MTNCGTRWKRTADENGFGATMEPVHAPNSHNCETEARALDEQHMSSDSLCVQLNHDIIFLNFNHSTVRGPMICLTEI
jgi:hypothetical protein